MTRSKTLFVLAAAVLAGAVLTAGGGGASAAELTITQNAVAPYSTVAGASVSAVLKVTASSCVKVQWLTVGVRDSNGNQNDPSGKPYDFAGLQDVSICPGYTLTTYPRTFATAGDYTIFGAYELNDQWKLLPSHVLHVGPAGSTTRPSWKSSGTYTAVAKGTDEFNSSALDTTKWSKGRVQTGGDPHIKNGLSQPINYYNPASGKTSFYETDCYSENNVAVSGGSLQLTLTNSPSTCYDNDGNVVPRTNYTGAMVNSYTKFSQSGGSFEARVYIPPAASDPTHGAAWPAWWMNGLLVDPSNPNRSTGWPDHGEIDIAEGGSGGLGAHSYYVGNSTGGINSPCPPGTSGCSPFVGWHNFGVSWDASGKTVTFYWDGASVGQLAAGPVNPANLAKYLDLQYSISEQSLLPAFPSTMQVDWVRSWQQP